MALIPEPGLPASEQQIAALQDALAPGQLPAMLVSLYSRMDGALIYELIPQSDDPALRWISLDTQIFGCDWGNMRHERLRALADEHEFNARALADFEAIMEEERGWDAIPAQATRKSFMDWMCVELEDRRPDLPGCFGQMICFAVDHKNHNSYWMVAAREAREVYELSSPRYHFPTRRHQLRALLGGWGIPSEGWLLG